MNYMYLVKDLRALTQAGMNDCKDALIEAAGDLNKAVDIIKKKGLNIVSAREGKIAADGLIATIAFSPTKDNNFITAAMVELNCQTDFVAKSSEFQMFTTKVCGKILTDTLDNKSFDSKDLDSDRHDLISKTKENIVIRRWWVEQAFSPNARVFSYVHSGKIGVLLTLLAPSNDIANTLEFNDLGNDLAMQIAAMNP